MKGGTLSSGFADVDRIGAYRMMANVCTNMASGICNLDANGGKLLTAGFQVYLVHIKPQFTK